MILKPLHFITSQARSNYIRLVHKMAPINIFIINVSTSIQPITTIDIFVPQLQFRTFRFNLSGIPISNRVDSMTAVIMSLSCHRDRWSVWFYLADSVVARTFVCGRTLTGAGVRYWWYSFGVRC